MDLLVVGSVAYDSIKTPFLEAKKTLGGSASYFSLAASYFVKPAVVGVVGNDFKAADVSLLKRRGVDVSGLERKQGKTFHWSGKYSFDLNRRDTLKTELGVFADFSPKLSAAHKSSPYVFLGNIHPKLQADVLEQIKKPKFVGLDTMNYWISSAAKDLAKILKQVDVLIINDEEARQLTKEHNIVKASKKIFRMMKPKSSLIIKRGEYGLLLFGSGKMFNLTGYPLEDVLDPTGAGDSFAGGFMGYLAASKDTSWNNLKKACVAGSALASFCVERMGTKGLLKISSAKINGRLKDFRNLTNFQA